MGTRNWLECVVCSFTSMPMLQKAPILVQHPSFGQVLEDFSSWIHVIDMQLPLGEKKKCLGVMVKNQHVKTGTEKPQELRLANAPFPPDQDFFERCGCRTHRGGDR